MALLTVNLETMNIDDFITPGISFIIYHFRVYKSQGNHFVNKQLQQKRTDFIVSGSGFIS